MISPAIRLEFDDVFSILTATSSHSSPVVDTSDADGVPPNHHDIFSDVVDVVDVVGIVLRWGIGDMKAFTSTPQAIRNADTISFILILLFYYCNDRRWNKNNDSMLGACVVGRLSRSY
jgi:hypothetical protein